MTDAMADAPGTVLVTGAAGFIGSHVAERLAGRGTRVIGLDNFDPYYARVEKEENVAAMTTAGVAFREADVVALAELQAVFEDELPDVVVHLAARPGVRRSLESPYGYGVTNIVGTQNVLELCRTLGIERVVFGSTSSVYGATDVVPFVEGDPCAEPPHPYAASKRSAELLCQSYARSFELQVTVLRLFTVYGPRVRPDMMARLLLESITTGAPVPLFSGPLARDWTFVDDVVDAVVAAVDRPFPFEVINVGRGEPVDLVTFIERLEGIAGRKANVIETTRPATELSATHASIDRMAELLEIVPSTSLDDGLAALWQWWVDRVPGD